MLAAGAQIPSIVKKTCFFFKKQFFHKTRSVGASWAPASQGPSLVATFYATCPGVLLLVQYTHFLIFRSCLGVLCSGGTPERVFLHFFRKGFCTRACTDFLGKLTQERLFLQRKKSEYKSSHGVRGIGASSGTRFCMYLSLIHI